jgi:DNA-binding IclR family transcriptional regulator
MSPEPEKRKGELSNEDLREAWGVQRNAASRTARRLVEAGWLEATGSKRWTRYRLGARGKVEGA